LAQAKNNISVEINPIQTSSEPPITMSSRQVVVDNKMMEDLLGVDYTMDEIIEATCAQPSGEKVPLVKPFVGQLDILETSHGHVHSPPRIDL
jgi:hypothetical protein